MLAFFNDGRWLGLVLGLAAVALGVAAWRLRRPPGSRQSRANQARRHWARRLADASFDGLLIHRNGIILQMNRALVRMLGYREVELVGSHFSTLAVASQVGELRTELEAPQPQVVEFTLLHADKTERFVEMASHTLDFDGLPATVTAIRNLTPLKTIEARLAHLVSSDALTGLPNRERFAEKLAEAVARNDIAGGTTAVLMLELQQLKALNEQLGRSGGDALLRQIASRLLTLAHGSDTVGRLGGTKFGIVQPHDGAPTRTIGLTSQIESSMQEPFIVDGKPVKAELAVGIALYPEHAVDAEGMLKASQFALSRAGASGVHMFSQAEAEAAGFAEPAGKGGTTPALRTLTLDQQRLIHDLRLGIPRGEISLEYQPVFGAKFLDVVGFEALVRWRHPKEGAIAPARFVALADDAGLATTLGNFILDAACMEAVRGKVAMMAVNLSPAQFRDPYLVLRIHDILQNTGLLANRLEVQVTEGMLLQDPVAAGATLKALQALGLVITLDNFGTGFSSISNLSDFPFNRIKIDKRFIQLLGEDVNAQKIVVAILSLARSLHLEVTAEGVESEPQLSFLQEKGCTYVQGYHLGRPAARASSFAPLRGGTAPKANLVTLHR